MSAHHVPVRTGHFVDAKCQMRRPVKSSDEVKALLRAFAPLRGRGLPSMPHNPIVVLDEVGRPRPRIDNDYEGGMAVCVGNVHTNDGFFDVTLSLCVKNVVRGAWGAALINLELYDLHVRPLIARVAGSTARDAVRDVQTYVRDVKPLWDVLLRWARSQEEPTRLTRFASAPTARSSATASGPGRTSRSARVRRSSPRVRATAPSSRSTLPSSPTPGAPCGFHLRPSRRPHPHAPHSC